MFSLFRKPQLIGVLQSTIRNSQNLAAFSSDAPRRVEKSKWIEVKGICQNSLNNSLSQQINIFQLQQSILWRCWGELEMILRFVAVKNIQSSHFQWQHMSITGKGDFFLQKQNTSNYIIWI